MIVIPNWAKSKKTIGGAVVAGLLGLGLYNGDKIENYLFSKNGGQTPASQTQQIQPVQQSQTPSNIEFEDGSNGSLTIKPSFGTDWNGDAYKITRNGKDLSKTFSTQRNSVQDTEVEDGTKYDYTLHGIDSNTGKLTGSRLSGDFTPYDDAFDYKFGIDAEDVRFDDKGNVKVVPSFETETKGNKVNFANFALVDSQGDTLDTELFSDLDKAEEGFKLNGGNYTGDAQVLGELRLERGNNVAALDSAEVLDDMPQFVAGTLDQNRHLQGYKMSVTDFQYKAEADSLWSKLAEDPSLAKYKTMFVNPDKSVTDPDGLVGKIWVNPDGTPVSYEEAFSVEEPVVAKKTSDSPWTYNAEHDISVDPTYGELIDATLANGNTVSGALEAAAKEAGREFDITAYDAKTRQITVDGYDNTFSIDDLVDVYRNGTERENFDPDTLHVGDKVVFTDEFKDLMYGKEAPVEKPVTRTAPVADKDLEDLYPSLDKDLSKKLVAAGVDSATIDQIDNIARTEKEQRWYKIDYRDDLSDANDQLDANKPRFGANYNYTLESESFAPEFSLDFPLDREGNWRLGAVFSPESTGTQDWGAYRDVDITRQSAGATLSRALTDNVRLGAGLEYTSEHREGLNYEKDANPYRASLRPEINLGDRFSITGNARATGLRRSFTKDFGNLDNLKTNLDYGAGLKIRF